ncbi:ribonuclease J [Halioxenophilus aromaticivorans]|uniref:Ribonuclease J n=1 Tax=Halioxenophilus aromaticivorans TaxID=1306992 RepID=A0AAV3U055_9ALTE
MIPTNNDLWFLPLGGCGEIGMNMSLYGHDGEWLMVDCGIGFDREVAGKRVITANSDFIAARRERLRGLLITHAHEDHVGAVAEHWPELRCPVYCTRFTEAILSRKLAEAGLLERVPIHVVNAGSQITLGNFEAEWVAMTHSTPESQGLVISTPLGSVFHTGDWKLDPDPIVGPAYNAATYQRIGKRGILAMVCDSTNATVPGHSPSEGELFRELLTKVEAATGRVVVACFGSNVARLVTLVHIAMAAGRYPALLGRSLGNYYRAARAADLWNAQREPVPAAHLGYLPANEVLAIATGSQGELGSALYRLANGNHPDLDLTPGDTVIFSSRVIPGNERELAVLDAKLTAMGVTVIHEQDNEPPIHASGHPARDELKAMYQWINPSIALPVHGEPHHLDAHAALAKQLGVPVQLNGRNGDLYQLAGKPSIKRGAVNTGRWELRR